MRRAMPRTSIAVLLIAVAFLGCKRKGAEGDEFTRQTNLGKNYYDRGQADKAVTALETAVQLRPEQADAHLNAANAYLRASQPQKALQHAEEVLKLDHSSGAAHYIAGCALLRLGKPPDALKALQQAKDIDRTINAVSFQLGRAHQQVGNFEEAAEQFREVVKFEPEHAAAHYNLSTLQFESGFVAARKK
jgi:tetratricopeptide (TPR) repeat protein